MLDFLSAAKMTHAPMLSYNTDLQRQKIRTLTTGQVATECGEVAWDGRDHSGQVIDNGVYLHRLETERVELTRKLLFLR